MTDRLREKEPGNEKLGRIVRKATSLTSSDLVETIFLEQGRSLPIVLRPTIKGVNPGAWAAAHKGFIEEKLHKYGAILFRGFKIQTPAQFEGFIKVTSGELLEYHERSSPRSQVSGNIYTSTDYPASESIFLHNENSYQNTWPMRLYFFCAKAADQGGETPIADCRKIYERIGPKVRDQFIQKRWMYVRNFSERLGLPWQTVFRTEKREDVEEYCRGRGIEVEWRDGNRLTTRAVRTAVAKHPKTGALVWFNHAAFFHVSTLAPVIRKTLLDEFREEGLPTNTYYGDGSPIEDEVLEQLRDAYRQEMVVFQWQEGDVLMLDNMLVAHGRMPYAGSRSILVGMADPYSRPEV